MSSVLITGGAGAIGSRLALKLLQDGHKVIVLDDLSSGFRDLVPEGAIFHLGSVENDRCLKISFGHRPHYVLHLAALFANQNSVENPEQDLSVNGMGTLKVLRFCSEYGIKKMVFVSSSCVYGQEEMDEGVKKLDPRTPYAMTKWLGEQYCQFWADQRGMDVSIARLFNNYGPGEYPGKFRNVIPNFFEKAMLGQPLTITGTGEETRDFNFVDDTVQGIVKCLWENTGKGEVFNIARGEETKILELAEKINALVGNKAGIEFKPPRDWDHVKKRRGNIEKARRVLGYSPSTPLDKGLEQTFAWISRVLK